MSSSRLVVDDENHEFKESILTCKINKSQLSNRRTSEPFTIASSGHWHLAIFSINLHSSTLFYDHHTGRYKYPAKSELKMQLCLNKPLVNDIFALFSCSLKQGNREVNGKCGRFIFSKTKLRSDEYCIPLNDVFENEDFQIFMTVHAEIDYKPIPHTKNMLHLLSLLKSGECSDVIIKVDGKDIKCHRSILSCRSSYFSAMFKSGLSESINNQIEITDFDYETIKIMVNFLYVFECPALPSVASAMSLLEAAHKYQITDLKYICENRVISKIDGSNVFDVLLHADTYSANMVKKRAMDFIWKNCSSFKKAENYEPLINRPYLLRDLLLVKVNESDAQR